MRPTRHTDPTGLLTDLKDLARDPLPRRIKSKVETLGITIAGIEQDRDEISGLKDIARIFGEICFDFAAPEPPQANLIISVDGQTGTIRRRRTRRHSASDTAARTKRALKLLLQLDIPFRRKGHQIVVRRNDIEPYADLVVGRKRMAEVCGLDLDLFSKRFRKDPRSGQSPADRCRKLRYLGKRRIPCMGKDALLKWDKYLRMFAQRAYSIGIM